MSDSYHNEARQAVAGMYWPKRPKEGDQNAKISNAFVLEEILPTLAKAKIFTVLDAKESLHQVKLDDASSYLTLRTLFGHYHYLWMPLGNSSAPEEFQWRMHSTLQGLPRVEIIADDVLVYRCGTTDEECQKDHDTNLQHLQQNLELY